jgi:hypothetical protein
MRIRLPRNTGDLTKRLVAASLLLGLLAEIAGIPVVPIAKKDRSRPYPCQDRPCGCASADECWYHCCCMNNKQKVAWARAHDISPPDFVIAAADQESDAATAVCTSEQAANGEGDSHEEHACCRHRNAHHDIAASENSHERKKSDNAEPKVKLVLSDFARQCSGLPQLISLLSDALPCSVPARWKPAETVAGFVMDAAHPCASADLSPPVPPPKLSRDLAA